MENYESTVSIESIDTSDKYKVVIHDDKDKKTLFYKEEDKTITTFNYEENILVRENDVMRLEYKFDLKEKTVNSIYIKELNSTVNVEITTKKIEKNENYIEIVYEIEETVFSYKIEKEKSV